MAKAAKRLFICLDNTGYEVSLERRKIYVALTDTKAERTGYLRIIDESGEDYLYPAQRFVAASCLFRPAAPSCTPPNNRFERSRGVVSSVDQGGVDDRDNAASF